MCSCQNRIISTVGAGGAHAVIGHRGSIGYRSLPIMSCAKRNRPCSTIGVERGKWYHGVAYQSPFVWYVCFNSPRLQFSVTVHWCFFFFFSYDVAQITFYILIKYFLIPVFMVYCWNYHNYQIQIAHQHNTR